MSNINEKVKSLLAFYASFESFKADIENKLGQLSEPVDFSGLAKEEDLKKSIDEISEEVKKAKFDAFAFDSARRTFGEEIGVLKSFIDKEIAKLNDALSEQSKQMQELKRLISAKDSSGRVGSTSSDRAARALKSDFKNAFEE